MCFVLVVMVKVTNRGETDFINAFQHFVRRKNGKVHPRTGCEGSDGE